MKYWFTGTFAIVLSWILSGALAGLMTGCRFGNNVEQPGNADTITGYYETQAQAMSFCASLTGGSGLLCAAVSTEQIPSMIGQIVTNPVALQLVDPSTGDAYLFAPGGSGSALPTHVDIATRKIDFVGAASPVTHWEDPSCTSQLYLEQLGQVSNGPQGNVQGYTTAGRLQLTTGVYYFYSGTCAQSWQEIRDCYGDAGLCGGANATENLAIQENVQALLDPYLDSSLITLSDIPSIEVLGYEVSYQ